MMRYIVFMAAVALFHAGVLHADEAKIVESRKIWDQAPHNAFTDLVHWKDRWWCTFREGQRHVAEGGKIRVITSADGQAWESAALIEENGTDLRDPKFSVTPDDRLMIVAGGTMYNGAAKPHGEQPRVMFSSDGRAWSAPHPVLTEGNWLWAVTWHDGKAYGVSYGLVPNSEWTVTLYSSVDGLKWDLVAPLKIAEEPNETRVRFDQDGNMLALVRREKGKGYFGSAKAPYTDWTWHELNVRLGGPNFLVMPDGSMIAGTRWFDNAQPPAHRVSMAVAKLTPTALEAPIILPSGGDCSYPGMVMHDGLLWVSYYSSHEVKTSIYLAKIKLGDDAKKP
jgi:hypothetical protein